MKIGMNKAEMPEIKTKDAAKAAMRIVGVGLAAGLALIAATDTILKKVTSKGDSDVEEELNPQANDVFED